MAQSWVLSVEEMLERNQAEAKEASAQELLVPSAARVTEQPAGQDFSAYGAAAAAQEILNRDGCLNDVWRFCVLQTIDYYNMAVKFQWDVAEVFREQPETDVAPAKAALASLAEFLSARDGWKAPGWAKQEKALDVPWFPMERPEYTLSAHAYEEARVESPQEFVHRNIFITLRDLNRV
ncbi:hypothetical protein SAMN05421878_10826 [Actinobaculum suis]|uniref:Uncharacterized protein n=1 Tax=Actinobaculum suis TaxID=1657 RepID=A0A1G7CM31_9ACTO|nr:hypothetical protein [Actinobaculum suis]MDY5152521.1 hypothetical protein [Actinobaculum suis]SDE40303.1 hypothetical protein SAMN05421878_10826 [Actinobaculum suis]VDG75575.1 Uncharacterised protein [Actinobaculum suis]